MNVLIVTPARPSSNLGNAVTAQRYAAFFRSARWKVRLVRAYRGEDADVLVALHARRSARSIARFLKAYPKRPVILVLTGTDAYRDLAVSYAARRSVELAQAIVGLQPLAIETIPAGFRAKARSIIQSAPIQKRKPGRRTSQLLRACVLGHLRAEKDPFRAAMAVRVSGRSVRVRVTQAGAALDPRYASAARREMRRNPRYRWIGEVSRGRAARLLRSSDVMVLSSIMEGGANVLCEAIASGIPVLASRIPGNIGILGSKYPGLFRLRDTSELARLLRRTCDDPGYYQRLSAWIRKLQPLVAPARERREWIALVRDVTAGSSKSLRKHRRLPA